jgi:hypothetical protein
MRDTQSIDRQVAFEKGFGVTDRAIEDEASHAPFDRVRQHQFTHQRIRHIPAGIDDDDVARLRHLDGFVDHEVVTWAGFNRQCSACQHPGSVHRAQISPCRKLAGHDIADHGHRQFCEIIHEGLVQALPLGANTETSGHARSFQDAESSDASAMLRGSGGLPLRTEMM